MRYESILDTIGNTPLVKLQNLTRGLNATIWAKLEYFNPGGSVKDRIALGMIDDAVKKGVLKPGGTIIEGTSGNTGVGLAIAATLRGYKTIFTIQDKQSREKINMLKAFGGEVVVCPTAVKPEDPNSYYSVSRRLTKETPHSYYPNQYDNPCNPLAHYQTTGPEIWKDMEGRLDYFVCGAGTGGTLSGVGKFLKEKNKDIKVVGADPVGSLYYEYFHKKTMGQAYPYLTEGIGEDFLPSTMQFEYIDDVIQVTDRDSYLWARKLAREEAVFSGSSAGTAIYAAVQVARRCQHGEQIVVLIPDSGQRYLSKVYNDEWMKDNQFLDVQVSVKASDILLQRGAGKETLVSVQPHDSVMAALKQMKDGGISQLPVLDQGNLVGSIFEDALIPLLLEGRDLNKMHVYDAMRDPFPVVAEDTPVTDIFPLISPSCPAVLVKVSDGFRIITKYDLLYSMAKEGKA